MTMRKLATLKLLALCALGATGVASAAGAYQAEASLASAVPAATNTEIDGVNWRCEGDKCTGTAERRQTLDSYMKGCRKVAAALGQLSAYSSKGREMSKRDLESCNTAAR